MKSTTEIINSYADRPGLHDLLKTAASGIFEQATEFYLQLMTSALSKGSQFLPVVPYAGSNTLAVRPFVDIVKHCPGCDKDEVFASLLSIIHSECQAAAELTQDIHARMLALNP